MKLRSLNAVMTLTMSAAVLGCPSKAPPPVATPTSDAVSVSPPPDAARRSGQATLYLMADIGGILRPCGCTVELQKGGFDRLIPFLEGDRKGRAASALFHAGPLFYEHRDPDAKKRAQLERQAEVAADLIARTGVVVAGATAIDQLGSEGRFGALSARAKVQVTAGNLGFKGGPELSRFVVEEIGGLRIGVFALAPVSGQATDGVSVSDPKAAAQEVIAELAQRSDVIVLLSALGLRETKRLVRKVDGIDFAVAGGMGEHPSVSDEAELVGSTHVMQFHNQGRYLGRLTLRLVAGRPGWVDASAVSASELAILDQRIERLEGALKDLMRTRKATDPEISSMKHHLDTVRESRDRLVAKKVDVPTDASSFSFTLTPLDWDLPQDAEVAAVMKAFDDELARINIANAGTLPEPEPGQAVYVGTATCIECHDETRAFWQANEHAHAWTTLVEAGKTFDVECVSCHVTGYGMPGGSLVGQTEGREAVQCEACHGPGSIHSEDALSTSITRDPSEELCVTCHHKQHSPRFEYTSFREHLLVPGHGRPLE